MKMAFDPMAGLESRGISRDNAISSRMERQSKNRDASFSDTLDGTMNKLSRKHQHDDKRLRDSCVEMESIFVGKMLKEMRKTVHKSDWLHGGYAEEIFEDMLYDEYALNISRNSKLGLADMLYKEMSQKI